MDNYLNILTALGGLILGTGAAYVNYLISKKVLNADNIAGIMGANAARLIIDALVLLAVFLLCRHFELPCFAALIAAATGLAVGGILFLYRLTKKTANDGDDGGE